jgi:hypothetical protein
MWRPGPLQHASSVRTQSLTWVCAAVAKASAPSALTLHAKCWTSVLRMEERSLWARVQVQVHSTGTAHACENAMQHAYCMLTCIAQGHKHKPLTGCGIPLCPQDVAMALLTANEMLNGTHAVRVYAVVDVIGKPCNCKTTNTRCIPVQVLQLPTWILALEMALNARGRGTAQKAVWRLQKAALFLPLLEFFLLMETIVTPAEDEGLLAVTMAADHGLAESCCAACSFRAVPCAWHLS